MHGIAGRNQWTRCDDLTTDDEIGDYCTIAFELGHCLLLVGERHSVEYANRHYPDWRRAQRMRACRSYLGTQLAVMTQDNATDENCGLTPSASAILINGKGMTGFA